MYSSNIWFNEAGALLVLNWSGTAAKRFDASGNFIDDFLTGLSNPEGVAFYPNGNILVGNGGTSAVKLFDAEGNFIEDIVSSGTGGLILPNAVVLREVTETVATEEISVASTFVQPTFGTVFYLDQSTVQKITEIEVYDLAGKLVDQKVVEDGQIWNASKFAEGTYIINGFTEDGQMLSQKVMVKKN